MSRKSKLERFAEVNNFENVYQCTDPQSTEVRKSDGSMFQARGQWQTQVFKNDNPLVIELACGKGEYTIGLAVYQPELNFIGIDIKGNRLHRGAKKGLELQLKNAVFLRIRIEWLSNHFAAGELDEIWITFPDPFLKQSKSNRRLTAPWFLDRYRLLLKPGGKVHLKTDSIELYRFTDHTLQSTPGIKIHTKSEDIDSDGLTQGLLAIQTYYESKHRLIGKKILYLAWEFVSSPD